MTVGQYLGWSYPAQAAEPTTLGHRCRLLEFWRHLHEREGSRFLQLFQLYLFSVTVGHPGLV